MCEKIRPAEVDLIRSLDFVSSSKISASSVCYNGAIMMARTQITLESETHKRARQRASELGVSLAEYFRRLVQRDLLLPRKKADVSCIFNLGRSKGVSNIARDKDRMIGEAIEADFERSRRR